SRIRRDSAMEAARVHMGAHDLTSAEGPGRDRAPRVPPVAARSGPGRARIHSPAREPVELGEHLLVGRSLLDDARELLRGARDVAAPSELPREAERLSG